MSLSLHCFVAAEGRGLPMDVYAKSRVGWGLEPPHLSVHVRDGVGLVVVRDV